jgi:transcriptional regulator with XRE-family HTH domain
VRSQVIFGTIGHLEGGTRQPSISIFCKLAYELDTTPSEFMKAFQDILPNKLKQKG